MKILLLGYGKEGQAIEKYLKSHKTNVEIEIWQDFDAATLPTKDYTIYDIIFRSPSVPPLHLPNESSVTKYFFNHCPCPIIGVTATKGKGTICSFIKSLLDAEKDQNVYLVGNIGEPAINILDNLAPTDVVVYELSSFQLWDLEKSPHISVIGQLEPDHLNVHKDYADYLDAKANITRYQTATDYCIYFQNNPDTQKLANTNPAPHKIPYPFIVPTDIKAAITLPGQHNQDNAIAAIAAVASYHNISPDEYIQQHQPAIIKGLSSFHGLPHRLEFIREINGIKFYDDNFSTTPSSTRVAINAFPNDDLTVIIGGRDKTDNQDLPELYEILKSNNVRHVVLIGESGHALAQKYPDDPRFKLAESLPESITIATTLAQTDPHPIVLMSPAAASFDMFKNVYDRGDQYKLLIKNL